MDPCVASTSGRGRHAAACAQQNNIGRGAAAQPPLQLVCRQQRREQVRSRRSVLAAAAPPPGETPEYRCGAGSGGDPDVVQQRMRSGTWDAELANETPQYFMLSCRREQAYSSVQRRAEWLHPAGCQPWLACRACPLVCSSAEMDALHARIMGSKYGGEEAAMDVRWVLLLLPIYAAAGVACQADLVATCQGQGLPSSWPATAAAAAAAGSPTAAAVAAHSQSGHAPPTLHLSAPTASGRWTSSACGCGWSCTAHPRREI